ncbi:hypothetical protein EV284_6373 [Streptomyces sp. BK022]|uniref:MAB_1171c family putative transporter n=1 Tax=Streptomyces sp. BK022 TaxID=2512123 RepID=UPI0010F1A9E5|nr:hypothetical protein EV284_6373 [Streptomyces sp. BK022]
MLSTDDLIDLCTTIPLWIVVAVRAYYWPKTSGKRAILATFAALAFGATLRLSPFELALADVTGIDDAAVLPKHLSVMVACTLLVGWIESVVPPSATGSEPAWRRWFAFKPRMVILAVTSAAAAVAFPFAAPSVTAPDGSLDFASGQYGDVAGTTHLCLYLISMGVALAPSALLCLTVARRTDDRLLRRCMLLMAAGAGMGVLYPVYRISFLVCGFTPWTYPLDEGEFHLGGSLIQLVTILLVIVGSSVRAIDLAVRAMRHRRSLIALRPLWEELVGVLSADVITDRMQHTPSAREERHRLRGLYELLDQRVVDVSDATFNLLPWADHDMPQRALDAAHRAGLSGRDAKAAQEAMCIRAARLRCVGGDEEAARPVVSMLTFDHDTRASAAWLSRVARFYNSPDLADEATRLAGHPVLQEAA